MSQDRTLQIVGVDAASSEIACRPEVFGQGYRFLKNFHSASGYRKDSRIARKPSTMSKKSSPT